MFNILAGKAGNLDLQRCTEYNLVFYVAGVAVGFWNGAVGVVLAVRACGSAICWKVHCLTYSKQ
uniref:Uncharacterized protein n=1 Tax=Kalanchoe fedtschenkoi TaxID=63787 RepID=A0A7N0VJG0_KALFE